MVSSQSVGRVLVLLPFALMGIFAIGTPQFEKVQPELLSAPGTLTNAWADFDNDGDLDLFVGFREDRPNRLYRNEGGRFTDVGVEVGVAATANTRAAAWGDFDADGHVDLYVGFGPPSRVANKLYRNEGDGKHFTDVAASLGADLAVNVRQVSWVDYDNDRDVDLFVAVRDAPNILLRNDGHRLTDVSTTMSLDDPRRSVGAVWFDFDQDGDLDLYVANQNGDRNGLFRNDGTHFVDVAPEHGLDKGGRPLRYEYGSIRPCLADFDNDGDLDVLVVNYGPNALFRNEGSGRFVNVAEQTGLAIDSYYDTGTWGDYDHDGRLDLYINGTITGGIQYRDYLFHNDGLRFSDATPREILEQKADHGAHWVDFDRDGDLDLSLTGASPEGMHHLFRNLLAPEANRRSLQVLVLDERGRYTRAGTEIRLFVAGTRNVLATQILDTGSGYNSQNAIPVHFGLAEVTTVDIEVTSMTPTGRKTARLANVAPGDVRGRALVLRVDAEGRLVE